MATLNSMTSTKTRPARNGQKHMHNEDDTCAVIHKFKITDYVASIPSLMGLWLVYFQQSRSDVNKLMSADISSICKQFPTNIESRNCPKSTKVKKQDIDE